MTTTAQSDGSSASADRSTAVASPPPLEGSAYKIGIKSTSSAAADAANVSISLGSLGSRDNRGGAQGGGGGGDSNDDNSLEVVLPKGQKIHICLEWSDSAEGYVRCSSVAATDVKGGDDGGDDHAQHHDLQRHASESARAGAQESCFRANTDGEAEAEADESGGACREEEAADRRRLESEASFEGGAPLGSVPAGPCFEQDGSPGAGSSAAPPSLVEEQEDKITALPPRRENLQHTYLTPPHGGPNRGPNGGLSSVPILLTSRSVPSPPHLVRDADAAYRSFEEASKDLVDGIASMGLAPPPRTPPSSWDEEAYATPNRCDTIEEGDNEDLTGPSQSLDSGRRERRGDAKDYGVDASAEEADDAIPAAAAEAQAQPAPPHHPPRDPNKVYFVMNRMPNKQTSYYISSGADVDPAVVRKPPASQSDQQNQSSSPQQQQGQEQEGGIAQASPRGGAELPDCDYRIDHVGRVICYDEESDVSTITVGQHELGMYPQAPYPQGAHPSHDMYMYPPSNQVYAYHQHQHQHHHQPQYPPHPPYPPHPQYPPHSQYPPHPQYSHQTNSPGGQVTHGIDLLGQIVDLITPQCCMATKSKALGLLQPWQSARSMRYHHGVRRTRSKRGSSKRSSQGQGIGSPTSSTKVRVEIAEPVKATDCLQSMRGSYL